MTGPLCESEAKVGFVLMQTSVLSYVNTNYLAYENEQ